MCERKERIGLGEANRRSDIATDGDCALPSGQIERYAKNMESQIVTIEVDVSTAEILRALQEKTDAQGITLDALENRVR